MSKWLGEILGILAMFMIVTFGSLIVINKNAENLKACSSNDLKPTGMIDNEEFYRLEQRDCNGRYLYMTKQGHVFNMEDVTTRGWYKP